MISFINAGPPCLPMMTMILSIWTTHHPMKKYTQQSNGQGKPPESREWMYINWVLCIVGNGLQEEVGLGGGDIPHRMRVGRRSITVEGIDLGGWITLS